MPGLSWTLVSSMQGSAWTLFFQFPADGPLVGLSCEPTDTVGILYGRRGAAPGPGEAPLPTPTHPAHQAPTRPNFSGAWLNVAMQGFRL